MIIKEKCGNCRYFLKNKESEGWCRRYPPFNNVLVEVFDFGWCGEWDYNNNLKEEDKNIVDDIDWNALDKTVI